MVVETKKFQGQCEGTMWEKSKVSLLILACFFNICLVRHVFTSEGCVLFICNLGHTEDSCFEDREQAWGECIISNTK